MSLNEVILRAEHHTNTHPRRIKRCHPLMLGPTTRKPQPKSPSWAWVSWATPWQDTFPKQDTKSPCTTGPSPTRRDRKSVVEGKRVYVRVDIGGRRSIKNKKK